MPSIYVAPLSDYNNGILHGVWIDFDKCNDAHDVWQAVNTMLAASYSAKIYNDIADEYAIHDYEGWPFKHLREYESVSRLWAVYTLLRDEIEPNVWEAFAEFTDNQGLALSDIDGETVGRFYHPFHGPLCPLQPD